MAMHEIWDASRQKWQAGIAINGRFKGLGRFKDINDAYEARRKVEREVFGEFLYDGTG